MVKDNIGLFGDMDELTYWKPHWVGMPHHKQDDLEPMFSLEVQFMLKQPDGRPDLKWGATKILKVNFENSENIQQFSLLLGLLGINCETKYCQYCGTIEEFSEKLGQKVNKETKSIWFPEAEIGKVANLIWICTENQ